MDALNPLADLPLGFGMALSQNLTAMEHFSSLSLTSSATSLSRPTASPPERR